MRLKKLVAALSTLLAVLLAGYLFWMTYFTGRRSTQEIEKFAEQNVDAFLRDARALAATPMFAPSKREHDAGPWLSSKVSWFEPAPREGNTPASKIPDSLRSALTEFVQLLENSAGDFLPSDAERWAVVTEAIKAADSIDLSWMGALEPFDHWDIEKSTPAVNVDCVRGTVLTCTSLGEVHPGDIELFQLARLRLVRGWLAKDLSRALRETRELARLMVTTQRRTAVLFAQGILSEQRGFVQSGFARGDFIESPVPLLTESAIAQRSRFLRDGAPFLSAATGATVFSKVLSELPRQENLCPLLHEVVSQAILSSPFLEPKAPLEGDFTPFYIGMEKLLQETREVCIFPRLRTAWENRRRWWSAEAYAGEGVTKLSERSQMFPYLRRAAGRMLTGALSAPRADKYVSESVEPRKWGPGPHAKPRGTETPMIAEEGIVQKSPTHFIVTKKRLDAALTNLNEILQSARMVPYLEPKSGKFRGFLLMQMEPNCIFRTLGLRVGDVLDKVNEIEMDNAAQGLVAFQALRGASSTKVRVIRGGKPVTLQYDIAP